VVEDRLTDPTDQGHLSVHSSAPSRAPLAAGRLFLYTPLPHDIRYSLYRTAPRTTIHTTRLNGRRTRRARSQYGKHVGHCG
jgi:hypothetical protein